MRKKSNIFSSYYFRGQTIRDRMDDLNLVIGAAGLFASRCKMKAKELDPEEDKKDTFKTPIPLLRQPPTKRLNSV